MPERKEMKERKKKTRSGNIIEFINLILSLVKRFVFPVCATTMCLAREIGLSLLILAFGHNLWNKKKTIVHRLRNAENVRKRQRENKR